jgi:hypothetical protein
MSSFCVEQLRLLLLVETRLIGRWDKWLVFQHKGEANIVRFLLFNRINIGAAVIPSNTEPKIFGSKSPLLISAL